MTTTATVTLRGTLTLPRKMRERFALQGETTVLLEATDDGILVRPAAVTPVEIYSEARLAEFDRENNVALAKLFPSAGKRVRKA